jgi:ribose transport system permease protein
MRAVFGAEPPDGGTISKCGRVLSIGTPRDAIAAGIAYLPEDRKDDGLVLPMSGTENVALASMDRYGPPGLVSWREVRRATRAVAARLQFRGQLASPARDASGGNQQKLVIGKWVLSGSDVLIFDEPTRGIDIGSKAEVYRLIHELAAGGAARADERVPPHHRDVERPYPRRIDGAGILGAAHSGGRLRRPHGRDQRGRNGGAGVMAQITSAQDVGSDGASAAAGVRLRALLSRHGREIVLPLVVAFMILLFSLISDVFFSVPNFRNIGVAAAALACVSFGQTFAIITAGLDLSVGATVALVSILSAFAMRSHGIAAGVLAALLTGCAVGLVNGLVIAKLKVFPFIATLATMSIISGLALRLSGGVPVTGVPNAFADLAYDLIFGIPVPVVIALCVLVVTALILRYTRIGRHIYAIGGNEEAARLSGIAIDRVKLVAYVLSGFCAAVGSIILTARVASGQPSLGTSLPLESVSAVVLGGVSLFGGRGSVIGVAFGVLFVSILSNGLNLLNVSSYTQMMVIGAALIVAVALDQALTRRGK